MNNKLQVQIKENIKKKDKRLKKTNEMLNAIKILKLYAWNCTLGKENLRTISTVFETKR